MIAGEIKCRFRADILVGLTPFNLRISICNLFVYFSFPFQFGEYSAKTDHLNFFKQAHRREKDTLTHQISSYIEAKKIPKREKSPKNNYNNDTEDFSVFPFALCFRPCMKFSQMEKDSNNNSSFYRCDGKFEFIS